MKLFIFVTCSHNAGYYFNSTFPETVTLFIAPQGTIMRKHPNALPISSLIIQQVIQYKLSHPQTSGSFCSFLFLQYPPVNKYLNPNHGELTGLSGPV
jgi:hypothetical protein